MKQKLVLCSMLLLIAFVDIAVAKGSPDNNEAAISRGSSRAEKQVALDRLPYRNLRDSSKWSKLIHGHALTASLRKKHAHGLQNPDECLECDLLFSEYGSGDMIGPIFEMNSSKTGGGGCDWKCCFKTCVGSAMADTGTLCTTNCTACGLTGNAWPCAVCAGCGVVGFAAIEFCGLHCCVNPGCPAG
jgi:hypothetical protein